MSVPWLRIVRRLPRSGTCSSTHYLKSSEVLKSITLLLSTCTIPLSLFPCLTHPFGFTFTIWQCDYIHLHIQSPAATGPSITSLSHLYDTYNGVAAWPPALDVYTLPSGQTDVCHNVKYGCHFSTSTLRGLLKNTLEVSLLRTTLNRTVIHLRSWRSGTVSVTMYGPLHERKLYITWIGVTKSKINLMFRTWKFWKVVVAVL